MFAGELRRDMEEYYYSLSFSYWTAKQPIFYLWPWQKFCCFLTILHLNWL